MVPLSFADPDTPGRTNTSIFAKRPISNDVDSCSSSTAANFPPVLILFGDHDWLRFPNVEEFVERANAKGFRLHYRMISKAGHHLYLDNADEVHAAIYEWRKSTKL
jgi:pimeloyl-ACP methyl ester carboxylesterase